VQARADLTIPLENDDIALVVLAFGDTPADILSQTYTPVPPIEEAHGPTKPGITSVHSVQKSPFSNLPTPFPTTRTPRSFLKQKVPSIRRSLVLYLLLVLSFAALALALRSGHKWRLKSQRLTRDNANLRRQLETKDESRRPRSPTTPPTKSSAEESPSPSQLQKDGPQSKVPSSQLDPDAQGPFDASMTKTEGNHPRDPDPLPQGLQDVEIRLTLPPPIEASPWPEPRPQ
jgi:hypothetical protein